MGYIELSHEGEVNQVQHLDVIFTPTSTKDVRMESLALDLPMCYGRYGGTLSGRSGGRSTEQIEIMKIQRVNVNDHVDFEECLEKRHSGLDFPSTAPCQKNKGSKSTREIWQQNGRA